MNPYFKSNSVTLYHGDAIELMKTLPDESVNCIVTSPAYWQLRDYGVKGQYGLEPTIEEHIDNLVEVFREARRVLRKDGVMWVNYGNAYSNSGKGKNADGSVGVYNGEQLRNRGSLTSPGRVKSGLPRKSILGLPWRLAFALQDDGWLLRQDIIWYKPNPMPESVKDRCTKSHEYIFMFTKSPVYFCNQLTEPRAAVLSGRKDKGDNQTFRGGIYTEGQSFNNSAKKCKTSVGQKKAEKIFRNMHSVWTIGGNGSESRKIAGNHYATYPKELVKRCILAGCPENGVVLDMFFGAGTTGVVAAELGKFCIGIELNQEYCEIAKKRLGVPNEN